MSVSPSPGYGRIRRGPMAADAFTQIRNAVFRDPRLSAKAMGIFGNISTHRDGWGITPESISTQMRDGVDSIKAGLRELEKYGYLQRERERRPNGTLGASSYYITDQPEVLEGRRPEPEGDFPPLDKPPVVEPPLADPAVAQPAVADQPHKKTNSTTPGVEHHPPSPPPADGAESAAEAREGGREDAPLTEEEQRAADALARATAGVPQLLLGAREIARLAPLVVPWLERTTEGVLREALTAGLPAVVGSPVGIVRRRLLDKLPPAASSMPPSRTGLPPWCGRCGDGMPAAEYNPRFRVLPGGGLCACHPDAA